MQAPQAQTIRVGDIIEFDGINWVVLDRRDDRVLMLTERIIDSRNYHHTFESITWENSSLRE